MLRQKNKHLEKENMLLHAHIKVIQEQVDMEKQEEKNGPIYKSMDVGCCRNSQRNKWKLKRSYLQSSRASRSNKLLAKYQIDVTHHVSNREAAPIIAFKKSDRDNFYYQKKRISDLHINQITRDDFMPKEDDLKKENPRIKYANESLTPEARELF